MELVVKDAVVTIEPKEPNSKESIVLKNATIATKIKDSNDNNTIKIKLLQESTVTIEFGERRIL